jgi:hypothetical protein
MPQIPFVEPDGSRRAVVARPGERLKGVPCATIAGTVLRASKT